MDDRLNRYSSTWFDLFLQPIAAAQTEREVAFIARRLPRPPYSALLDLCCGQGRHARLLAARGYRVLGVDRDPAAIAGARRRAGDASVTYLVHDMRRVADLPEVDAVLCLWQSFGYFDEATNLDVLRQIAAKLPVAGRLILDVYHRGFFEQHQDEQTFARGATLVTERKRMIGDRLRVSLTYEGRGESDTFEWQLYTPEELRAAAGRYGLDCILACSGFDEATPPSPASPRMQIVFERRADQAKSCSSA